MSLSAVKVKVRLTEWDSTLTIYFASGGDCTENRGLLVAQPLLELTAKLDNVQQANYLAFCENAVAHSMVGLTEEQITGKKAGLFCQTVLVFQGPVANGFCWL